MRNATSTRIKSLREGASGVLFLRTLTGGDEVFSSVISSFHSLVFIPRNWQSRCLIKTNCKKKAKGLFLNRLSGVFWGQSFFEIKKPFQNERVAYQNSRVI